MESDSLTPKKNRKSTVCDPVDSGYTREKRTRCIIERIMQVDNGARYEKVCKISQRIRRTPTYLRL